MWRSKSSGFTIIEVLCSLFVVTLLLTFILNVQLSNIMIARQNEKTKEYALFMEALKNNIIYNWNKNDVQNIKNENKIYIKDENIDIDNTKRNFGLDILESEIPDRLPYAAIFISQDKIFKITLELHYNVVGKEKIIKMEAYKGNHI